MIRKWNLLYLKIILLYKKIGYALQLIKYKVY